MCGRFDSDTFRCAVKESEFQDHPTTFDVSFTTQSRTHKYSIQIDDQITSLVTIVHYEFLYIINYRVTYTLDTENDEKERDEESECKTEIKWKRNAHNVPSTFFWCFHYNLLSFSHSSICIIILQLHTTEYKIVRQLETKFTFLRICVKQKIVVSAVKLFSLVWHAQHRVYAFICFEQWQCQMSVFLQHIYRTLTV